MAKKKEKKEKKAGKRMSKKELAALLIDFFHAKSSETLSMKYIFSELRLTTHPQKILKHTKHMEFYIIGMLQ